MAGDTFFSLILATVGDPHEVGRLLNSIASQKFRDFELVVVDQNDDDRLVPLLSSFEPRIPLAHIRCERGLSKARNAGLALARGTVVGFPDDDCWYPPDLLAQLAGLFRRDPDLMGLTGLCIDETGRPSAGGGSRRKHVITKGNVWGLGVSAAMFLRKRVFEEVGGFDESLGLGAKTAFQSGEETDLLLRIITKDRALRYDPAVIVYHPLADTESIGAIHKARKYGRGMGRVLRLHDYSLPQVALHLAKPAIGTAIAFLTNRPALARLRWARTVGRREGWSGRCNDVEFRSHPIALRKIS